MALQNPANAKNSSTSIRSQYRKDLTVLQENLRGYEIIRYQSTYLRSHINPNSITQASDLDTVNPDKLAMRIKRKSNNRLAVPGLDSFAKEFRGNELIHQQCINLQNPTYPTPKHKNHISIQQNQEYS